MKLSGGFGAQARRDGRAKARSGLFPGPVKG
jgi:hypothetical protein